MRWLVFVNGIGSLHFSIRSNYGLRRIADEMICTQGAHVDDLDRVH